MMLRRWVWATWLLAVGYVVGTAAGFATFHIGVVTMWLTILLLMPLLFAALALVWLRKLRVPAKRGGREMAGLIAYWVLMSFLLDALTYIFTLPHFMHTVPNRHFFVDQSPWIWLSYATLCTSGAAAVALHKRSLRPV